MEDCYGALTPALSRRERAGVRAIYETSTMRLFYIAG
jgi:hypothetical protein